MFFVGMGFLRKCFLNRKGVFNGDKGFYGREFLEEKGF
jgi:hypothetical protein